MNVETASPAAAPTTASIEVRFWGVRGSICCPGSDTVRYGGNTPCVELRCGEHVLIFDAGTGIRGLGETLMQGDCTTDLDIFLSHCHYDHLVGLPFFAPLFAANRNVRIWAGNLPPTCGIEDTVRNMMSFPFFPLQVDALQATVEFRDFRAGDTLEPWPGVTVRTAPLAHPGGATGYRIEHGGRAVAYLTDLELGDGPADPTLLALARDVDLMILDTTFTDEQMPLHIGWGHSSWRQGVRLANAANAKRLCLFHHNPKHDDAAMDAIEMDAGAARPGTIAASEGMRLEI